MIQRKEMWPNQVSTKRKVVPWSSPEPSIILLIYHPPEPAPPLTWAWSPKVEEARHTNSAVLSA